MLPCPSLQEVWPSLCCFEGSQVLHHPFPPTHGVQRAVTLSVVSLAVIVKLCLPAIRCRHAPRLPCYSTARQPVLTVYCSYFLGYSQTAHPSQSDIYGQAPHHFKDARAMEQLLAADWA